MDPNTVALPPDPVVRCPNCGMLIGYYVQVGNQTWLQVGALQQQSLHGRCCQCHTEFHFCSSDKMIEHLISRILEGRNGIDRSKC